MHADVARHGGSNDEDIGFFWTSIAGPARGGDPLGLPFVEIGASALNKADIPFPDGLVGAARDTEENGPVDFHQRRTAMIKRPIIVPLAAALFAIFGFATASAQSHAPGETKVAAAPVAHKAGGEVNIIMPDLT